MVECYQIQFQTKDLKKYLLVFKEIGEFPVQCSGIFLASLFSGWIFSVKKCDQLLLCFQISELYYTQFV